MTKYTLLAFMTDDPGVLNKVAMIIRRKMYNVDTLTVSETETEGISRMTISVNSDNPEKVKQVAQQIDKVVEVQSIEILDPENSYWREVALIKCNLIPSKLEYMQRNYGIEILFEKENEVILQVAGTSGKIDALIGEITMKNITEIARSGITAMQE